MKILIIKLGAKGDVVRTLPILLGLKEKYPDSEITWITKPSCVEIISTSPHINNILVTSDKIKETFDILYNFDIDDEATALAMQTSAEKKYGFYKEGDYASAFNLSAEYYLNTLFDDDLKKENKKTYQEMMFNAAELEYKKQHHSFYLSDKEIEYSEKFIKENGVDPKKLIGIHIGSSPRWPSKSWSEEKIKEFIVEARKKGYGILLFAGPDDLEKNKRICADLEKNNIPIYKNNPENSDKEFASLINICKFMVCSDSYALHISLALKKPTICLFFCTSPHEVEGYGLLKKIISPSLYDYFPEKQDQYSEKLINSISVEQVLKGLNSFGKNG